MTAPALLGVPIAPLPLERFRDVLDDDGYQALMALQRRAAQLLAGRASSEGSISATPPPCAVDSRWCVLQGRSAFFAITKRLHDRLHGEIGDGGPLGDAERAGYEA
jgi:trehalose synthase